MIQSYKKVLDMESVVSLKLEQDKRALEKVRKILYQEKEFFINKLIAFLKQEAELEYFPYRVIDMDYNVADILIQKDSKLFKDEIEGKEFVEFNVEELIDSRMFDNDDQIIITDLNFDENFINLGYLCESLGYKFLSYSDEMKDKLSIFVDYVINKNINKK